jgi:hypothetical protein
MDRCSIVCTDFGERYSNASERAVVPPAVVLFDS